MEKKINRSWWKNAFVYQIYPLSFCDSNGDGIGDIQGIISRLDYLKELGIDVIWLSPVFQSPMEDNGYDISNYDDVNPMFGTKADLQQLIQEVHRRGMKIISDVVVNHTSIQHPWFQHAMKNKQSPYRPYYIFSKTPNDITSIFSGPAWEKNPYDPTEYYFHLFAKGQPDLNWSFQPMREAIYAMINRWLDFGFDGFRLDVIDLIGKQIETKQPIHMPTLMKYLKEMYEACFKGRDVFTVGELAGSSVEQASHITDETNGFLTMGFQFSHLWLDEMPGQGKWALKSIDWVELKKLFVKLDAVYAKQGWNAIFMSNHDQPRPVSRYGNDQHYRLQSMKMLMLLFYGLRGTPYVYQGDEMGMTNYPFVALNEFKDIESLNYAKEAIAHGKTLDQVMVSLRAKGRDNARTPMQWNNAPHAGFSTRQPWLAVNPNFVSINAESDRNNKDGIYRFLQTYITYRKKHAVFSMGDVQFSFIDHPHVVAYTRTSSEESILILLNTSPLSIPFSLSMFSDYHFELGNGRSITLNQQTILPPYFGGVFRKGNHGHY
jgi:oligo-1,6-glucosidase/glucan 1,6-alpha-glucosidase